MNKNTKFICLNHKAQRNIIQEKTLNAPASAIAQS
jgi:hypothetical protein